MYIYIEDEPSLFVVGFYGPDGRWHAKSDWATRDEAAQRVNYLNGGAGAMRQLAPGSQPVSR